LTPVTIDRTILKNLLCDHDYSRKVLPFLKEEYFLVSEERFLFTELKEFINKYNNNPTVDALKVEVARPGKPLKNNQLNKVLNLLNDLDEDVSKKKDDSKWLTDSTEEFCKEMAMHVALEKSINIMSNQKGPLSKGAIPGILAEALGVSFDQYIGHDFLEQYNERYDFYHEVVEKVPFDLEFFNKITRDGVPRKTLNIVMAGTGVGKSLFMCHLASHYLKIGKNVLYITMEMAEKEIARRIDANTLDITMDDLQILDEEMYGKKLQNLKAKTDGKLIIKEFPTAGAGALHFRALLNELRLKKSFVPDIIFIDYLNICCSSRVKLGSAVNSYSYIKAIAEELRGLAVEFNVPVWSATQLNITGFTSSDVGLENTSESFGLPATADLMFAIISNEQLDSLNQFLVKQLKNRYNSLIVNRKFVIGVDRSKMKLYDVEQSAQADISESGQEEDEPVKVNKFKTLKV